jgi:hypothetical protein
MKRLIAAIATVAAVAAGASAHATQFVTNGDFTELSNGVGQQNYNTVATGWNVPEGGYTFIYDVADNTSVAGQYGSNTLWDATNGGANTWNGLAANGGNFAAIDGDFQDEPLTQLITGLTPGNKYYLSFNYAFGQQYGFDGATVQSLSATFGDLNLGSSDNFNVASHGFTGWQQAGGYITADSTSELLSFVAHGNLPVPPFALVSNVSLTGGVPEPATWTMMILGLGSLGAIARRRRAVAHAAA